MIFIDFLRWWYGDGWRGQLHEISRSAKAMLAFFSVPLLIKTLFAPWHQITAESYSDESVSQKSSKLIDNTVSRLVGFTVRSMTLLIAGICSIIVVSFEFILLMLWVVVPVLPATMFALGVFL